MGFQLSKRAAIVNILAHFAAFDGVYVRLIYYVSHLVPIFFLFGRSPTFSVSSVFCRVLRRVWVGSIMHSVSNLVPNFLKPFGIGRYQSTVFTRFLCNT